MAAEQRTEGEGKQPAHTHPAVTRSHDYSRDEETRHHGKVAHVHDHAVPARSPA